MKEMGAPERARMADCWSNAFHVFTVYSGIQQMKNIATMMISIRMTRFLARSLASEVLLRGLSGLEVAELLMVESSMAGGFLGTWM